MRGPYYEDYCSIRVIELSKIKSSKSMLVNTKVEVCLIRPGIVTDSGEDSSIKSDEDRIKLLDVMLVQKVKG